MAVSETARSLPDRLDASASAAHERQLPVEDTLGALLPESGIRRGTTLTVCGHGSVTLATALAAEASRRGSWVAAVGMADLGVSALTERGVDLQRWALVDLPAVARGQALRGNSVAADVLGAVVGGFDLVLVGSQFQARGATARRLTARIREQGTSLICALGADDPADFADLQPEVRVRIEQVRWTGVDDGHGRLLARQAEVAVGGRGAASRTRRMQIWLPSADGRVACVAPDQALALDHGLEDLAERRAG